VTLQLRHIRLRAQTENGPYGADIPLGPGLNVLWADNTKGKSTCLQGLLYALGLERMLSPRREVPLTYVMTSHLEESEGGPQYRVLESSVWVELANGAGEIIAVRRNVVSSTDRKLVSVFYGPALTEPGGHYTQRDFFVWDPGAAQREAGFHRMLADFIGWQLPTVRRFDGSETSLYLETIFPLLYVEQKAGWSSMPAAFPTYFQIRDVSRRAVEFLISLQTHEVELIREQLELDIAENRSAWSAKREEMRSIAELVNGRIEAVPAQSIAGAADIERGFILVPDGDEWHPLDEQARNIRDRLEEMYRAEVPNVEEVADATAEEIDRLTTVLSQQNGRRAALFRARQAEVSQRASIARRIAALEEDLQKNLDAQKLRDFGSKISETLSADHCPTCSQPIQDTLLAQQASAQIMPVESNIEYIRSQRAIFQKLSARTDAAITDIDRRLAAATAEANETSGRLRALRADMVAPSHSPSIAAIQERLRREAQLQALEDVQQRFEQQKGALVALAARYAEVLTKRASLPIDRFSTEDQVKLGRMTNLIREQARAYGFSTFAPEEIDISPDNYRPQKEGFEIGFELSASDAIRLKWAYHLALLELARYAETNHLGFVVFDEPRQQATRELSFQRLLERASAAKASGQQVIFATSEKQERLDEFLSGVNCQLLVFQGYMLRKIID